MINKMLIKNPRANMLDLKDLEAADALLELSNGVPKKETSKKQLNVRFIVGNSFEKNNKKRKTEENYKGEVEFLLKPSKKYPPRHPGFSFSIIHFLSAIRIALITPNTQENDSIYGKNTKGGGYKRQKHTESGNIIIADTPLKKIISSFTIHELMNRLKLIPGDTRVFEFNMPLRVLIKGALMMFTLKTAPPGAKSWSALTEYDKISKTWSWIGPVSSFLPLKYGFEEEISPNAWGISCRTLSKMVDFYAHWVKETQHIIQRINNLPSPPLNLMYSPSMNERFHDGKSRKNLVTLTTSCEEVREYFRVEEALRYSIPEYTFSYTALDGKKSNVAPLRRSSGKPMAKIREHFILKQDRPPQFTVLCLVRDAASRLPDRLGTRLDICMLVRDSSYILEEVTDLQISQVVSGALDRLHYENDPCVRFHKSWRVWVYLHGDREAEDFDVDCTSSRKIRKRGNGKLGGKSGIEEGLC